MKPKDMELLKHIAEFEDSTNQENDWRMGWCWRQVRIWPGTLNRLCLEGYLDTLFRSNRYTGYKLTEKAHAVLTGGEPENTTESSPKAILSPPDDIFEDIIGHEQTKELLLAAQLAEQLVSCQP